MKVILKTDYQRCFADWKKSVATVVQAEVWLREEAQKEGWAKVSKMKDRTAAKGLIAVNYLPDQSAGAIVELKCETDFVAKTMEFQTLAASIAALCSKMVLQSRSRPDNALSKITLQPEELLGLRYSESGATIADAIALEVGKLGENAKLNRAVAFLGSSDLQVAACTHPTVGLPSLPNVYLAYRDAVMSRRRVFEWYKRFKEGREETADNERSGRPSTSTTPEKVDKVLELVLEDRRITVREVAEEAGISFGVATVVQAEVWLREEAQKEGWAKVSKMKDRTAAKGLIAVNYLPDQSAGAIVELKCETDFVAKTMEFQTLAASIAALCSKMVLQSKSRPDNALSKITLQPEELLGLRYSESGATIADAIALEVGKLGENAKLNRAVAFLGSSDLQVAACTHPTVGLPSLPNVYLGQHGALLAYRNANPKLAEQICKHIVGLKPKSLGTWKEFEAYRNAPPPSMTEEEQVPRLEEEGVVPKDALEEEYQVERSRSFSEDEHRLLCQEFLMNPDMFVGDLLKQSGMEVVDFARITCGEEE
ncbi:TSFM [Cordylochernes scorpioides]|uniref:Elongation factor Ts, mitochondrial n=1 Tax=Cordylochernes scorpioides TaxID=51811 RepID=A0ABY6K1T6_9ARAC|nr:TSFM [Cordylochernes scorpioides]